MTRRFAIPLVPILLLVASLRPAVAQAVRDSGGVRIVSIDLDRQKGSVRLSPRPVLDLGGSDDEREQLFRVGSIARLSDGSIVVVNNGTSTLKIFDRGGRYLRDVAGRGEGPAEFQTIDRAWVLPGDTIVVAGSRRRLVFFTSSGGHVRTVTMQALPSARPPRALDLLAGRKVVVASSDVTTMPPRAEPYVFTQTVFVYGLDGQMVNPIGTFAEGEFFVQTAPPQMGGIAYWSRTFGRTPTIRADAGDVLVGDGATFELRRFSPTGVLTTILRSPYVAPAVTSADRTAVRAASLERTKPEDRPVEERRLAEMPYPDRFPAFQRFEVDPEGRIWVKRYPRPGATRESWWVIARDGTSLGEITLPERAVLRSVGRDWVACVARDADDVEHVQIYSLTVTAS